MLTSYSLPLSLIISICSTGAAFNGFGQVPRVADIHIESLELDQTTVTVGCSGGKVGLDASCSDSSRTIRVKTATAGSAARDSHLETLVTGGRTVRINANEFDWHLEDLGTGTYTIRVSPVTKRGEYGSPKTATVIVKQCECSYVDACRKVTVSGPSELTIPGERVQFIAKITGRGDVTYNWSVSSGTITTGQGTPTIMVDTDSTMAGQSLTATVDVPDLGGMACGSTASETVTFVSIPSAKLVDEFSTDRTSCEDVFARLDYFYTVLNNDPAAAGVIIVYSETPAYASGARRQKQIRNHIKMRAFDPMRVTFVNGPLMKDAKTEFWIVPSGAAVPSVKEGIPTPSTAKVSSEKSTPYLYAGEYLDGIPGCSGNLYDLAAFADVLNSVPKSGGRLVISDTNPARFSRKKAEIYAELKKNGVAAARLTAIFKKVRSMNALESVELWVVPVRHK